MAARINSPEARMERDTLAGRMEALRERTAKKQPPAKSVADKLLELVWTGQGKNAKTRLAVIANDSEVPEHLRLVARGLSLLPWRL